MTDAEAAKIARGRGLCVEGMVQHIARRPLLVTRYNARSIRAALIDELAGTGCFVHTWNDGSEVRALVEPKDPRFEYLLACPDGDCEVLNCDFPEAGWFRKPAKEGWTPDPELIFRRRIKNAAV